MYPGSQGPYTVLREEASPLEALTIPPTGLGRIVIKSRRVGAASSGAGIAPSKSSDCALFESNHPQS